MMLFDSLRTSLLQMAVVGDQLQRYLSHLTAIASTYRAAKQRIMRGAAGNPSPQQIKRSDSAEAIYSQRYSQRYSRVAERVYGLFMYVLCDVWVHMERHHGEHDECTQANDW